MEYEVIQEIEVLQEFSSDILSEIYRLKKANGICDVDKKIVNEMEEEVADIYRDIFKIETIQEALITRGKLQIVNGIVKKFQGYQSRGIEN